MQSKQFNISTALLNVAISIFGAFLFFQLMSFLEWQTRGTGFHTIFRVFGGGSTFVGFLKTIMYGACIYGALDITGKFKALEYQTKGFQLNLLPLQEHTLLNSSEVEAIRHKVTNLENQGIFYTVAAYVKKTCAQYHNDHSISDTLQVLDLQLGAGKEVEEGKLENQRYLVQTVPMLGFIGTIVELTAALQKDLRNLDLVRQSMEGAFDATLVALSGTILLTWLYHRYIGELDVFYAQIRSYITDNLVSRIISRQVA